MHYMIQYLCITNCNAIMRRDDLIKKIEELKASAEPDAVSVYNEIISELSNVKKYGLVWDNEIKKEDVVLSCFDKIPSLTIDDSKTIINGGENNLLIEGDNYHSLLALNMVMKESIDFIYIDPPYNTGKEDFVYNDKFVDKEDEYIHSKWLSFMNKRLKLAKDLLKDDGIIFISIDDHEQANLKLLCDDVFGEDKFLGVFHWKKTATPPSLSKNIRKKYEYILCYANKDYIYGLKSETMTGGDAPLLNGANQYSTITFNKDSIFFKLKDGVYKKGRKESLTLENDIKIKDGKSDRNITMSGNFKWSQETVDEEVENGTTFIVKSNKFSIRYERSTDRPKIPSNDISKEECGVGTNEDGSKELKKIFDAEDVFSHPKPTSLVKYIIKIATHNKKNAVVLDFFAGSGTTGQAVLELNKEDEGNRKFILLTNNDKDARKTLQFLHDNNYMLDYNPNKNASIKDINKRIEKYLEEHEDLKNGLFINKKDEFEKYGICQSVTYPRIKTVITGHRMNNSKFGDGLPGSLFYFKSTEINNNDNFDQAKRNMSNKIDALLCIKENIFEKIATNKYSSHYYDKKDNKHLFIYNDYYRDDLFNSFINQIKECEGTKIVYMYNLDDYVESQLFEGIDNIRIKAMPSKMYDIYNEIIEEEKGT